MARAILLPLFGDLGDTVLWIPAVRAVRERFPEYRIVTLCNPVTGRILTELALVDGVIDADKHLFDHPASIARPRAARLAWQMFRRLQREQFEMMVLFHHLVTRWGAVKFGIVALASGAPRRIGLDNGRGWFFTESVEDAGFGDRHEAQYWLEVAALAGASGTLRLDFPMSDSDRAHADKLVGDSAHRPLIAMHPGTGSYGPGRRWSASNFAAVGRLLERSLGARIVLLGTDVDSQAAQEIETRLGADVLNLVGSTDVGTLGAVLTRCVATVANDGGVAHVSAAVGTPTVVIFGPSNDRAWQPIGSTVVSADIPCRPCFYRDFERGKPGGCATRECLTFVTPSMVVRATETVVRAAAVCV